MSTTWIDVIGLCSSAVSFYGIITPPPRPRAAWLVAGIVCFAFCANLAVEYWAHRQRVALVAQAVEALPDQGSTLDELHAALGTSTIKEISEALLDGRARGLIRDSLIEFRDDQGRFRRTRIFYVGAE